MSNMLNHYIQNNFDKLHDLYTTYLMRSYKKFNLNEFKTFAGMILDGKTNVESKFDEYLNTPAQA